MTDIQKYIEECKQQEVARLAEIQATQEAAKREESELFARATEEQMKVIAERIPAVLMPFVQAEPMVFYDNLKALREGHKPDRFVIKAPGVSEIHFRVNWDNQIECLCGDWADQMTEQIQSFDRAVALAAAHFEKNAEAQRCAEIEEAANKIDNAKLIQWRPTPIELFEEALRTIIQNELQAVMQDELAQ